MGTNPFSSFLTKFAYLPQGADQHKKTGHPSVSLKRWFEAPNLNCRANRFKSLPPGDSPYDGTSIRLAIKQNNKACQIGKKLLFSQTRPSVRL